MKLKQLQETKQYASVTDMLLGTGTGTTLPASVMKQPTDNGYKAKATTDRATDIAKYLATAPAKTTLTEEQVRRIMAEELARQAAANNGTTAAASTDTAEEPETVELPEPAEELTTSQKILAWAKDNMLIVAIAAAVIIYIMYRRAQ